MLKVRPTHELGSYIAPRRQECLKDTIARVLPYWEEAIVPELKAVKQQSVAHWSSRQQREQTNYYIQLARLNIEGGKN